ncbi:pyridoxal phosphate-dependent transferase [Pyronema omphalodes]|nr:pyridoxal phosphate-dependent transferase [Pyronema omphalodes]
MTTTAVPEQSNILHRVLNDKPHHAVSSSGIEIHLSNSHKVIDAAGGASVAILGHTQPTVIEALTKQMSDISYVYSGAGYSSNSSEELASLILSEKPGGLCKAIFVCSGSEAMECALKLARQYHCERGDTKRIHYISRKNSYHGNTLGALGVSGHPGRRAIYEDMLSKNVSFVEPCYIYRGKKDGEDDNDYLERLKEGIEEEFQRVGADKVAAFVAETVSGASLGCATAVPGYFKAVRQICDKYGALMILDEVMCGMGKTGTLHAWQQEGITGPDIQTVAKALGGGFVPIGGVLMNQKIFDALASGSGILQHGHTYIAHPGACAAAAEVQKIIKRNNLMHNVMQQGKLLETLLKETILPLKIVGDVRGRGLYWGIELVNDKETKRPFDRVLTVSTKVAASAMALGLGIMPTPGAGSDTPVDILIVSPPYVVTEEDVRSIVKLLKAAIEDVTKTLEDSGLL